MMHLHYKVFGKGHPLIILHGLFGSLDNWHSISRRFGEYWKVYAVDQRNHGRSPHSETFSYQVMAEDLQGFMKQAGISSAHLLGHSMGGKTAMEFAVTHPDNVEKLVVVDIAPKAYPAKHDDILDALCSLHLSRFTSRHDIDQALAEKIPEQRVRQFLLKNVARTESGTFKWRINLSILRRHYSEVTRGLPHKRRFEKPTLFIRGDRSGYIEPSDETMIYRIFPNTRIETIWNAGHWVHADAPEEFSQLVMDFLLS